jgi:predicted deacylase
MSDKSDDPAAYPIEISPPDITPYRQGNTGVPYFTSFDSGQAGAYVLVTAVMHGNELCGAIVLDEILKRGIAPLKGKLTLGFCNVAAYQSFNKDAPMRSRFVDEDMNRVWDPTVLDGARDTVETRRAREIRPLLDTVDVVLDVHSMQHATPALMLCGPVDKGRELACQLGVPKYVVADHGHAAGKRMRDYGGFSDPADPRNALLVECGQHWEAKSVDIARQTVFAFLVSTGVIAASEAKAWGVLPPEEDQICIEVTDPITVKNEKFAFQDRYIGMEIIEKAGTLLALDGEDEVRTPHDNCVLIMPSRRLGPGQTAVRLGRLL